LQDENSPKERYNDTNFIFISLYTTKRRNFIHYVYSGTSYAS
jgi:hypothetical protein